MITPLIKIGALKMGCEFETSLTKRRGCVIDRYVGHVDRASVCVQWDDGAIFNLHYDVKVRPVTVVH